MKKRILALAVIIACVATISSGTWAYFTAEDTAHNVIASDGVAIQIEEWQQLGEELAPYPEEGEIVIMPGVTVSKIVTVKNMDAEAYVRAMVDMVIKDENGEIIDVSSETLDEIVGLEIDDEAWQSREGDEWRYYKDALAFEDATLPLFTEVVFDGPNMTNEYQNCRVEIIVHAQAVQVANNGATVWEASGWPVESAE